MKSIFTILGFLVVGVFLLAACNSAQTPFVPPTEEEHGHEARPIEGALEIRVEGGDFYFEPEAGMKGTLIVEESHGP